ncbi:MMPL family transporter [Jiangella mangrovi]|uniref:RND superfamily putative drug exporter n=1 Tax=Jiangella mangrovi TaxID=1524084 RepID=A0A7W9GM27_9ACTN|nr:MMPL family transporter [Jiangella mangrovi]MBB5786181.1 RND superfamily putative drug exporter [Jiangella mangrovi]
MTTTLPLDRPPAPTPPLPPPPSRGLVVRVARWSATHKWLALVLWLAFVAAAIVGGGAVGTKEVEDGDSGVGASAGADKALMQADFDDPVTESVLVQSAGGGAVDTGSDAVGTLTANLAAAPGVASVGEPQVSEDGTAALYEVTLDVPEGTDAEEEDAASAAAAEIGQAIDASSDESLVVGQVGDASLGDALDKVYEDDLQRAEYLSLPVSLLIMLVVFGALIAAAVPVLLALSSVVAAMGLSAFASYVVPSTDILASVVLLVGMAVGVDYSLFYVRREREEREKGRGTMDAVAVAAATSGRAVVVSGLAVIIAMAGMFFAGEATFQSLAVGTILVVAVAVVGSVTALPALLSIFGRWIDRPRIPLLWRLRKRDGSEPRVWRAILGPVLRHPKTALTAGLLALLALAAPAIGMKLSQPGISDLSKDVPAVQTYDAITTAFPSEGAAHDIGVWTPDGSPLDQNAVDAAVAQLSDTVAADPEFAAADGLVADYSVDGSVAEITVPVPYEHDDDRAEASLQTLRDDLVPAAFDDLPNTESGVTGMTAGNVDFRGLLADRMPIVIGFVLLMTIVVLVMAFRSLAVALTAAGLNLLSVAASYGLLTLVFQNSWAEGLLGFESTGAIITWLPLFLFVILFGLSMDYHVFVVSRIREGAKAGMTTREAVRTGIIRSAGVVTSAAIVMVAVFSIFATLGAIDFKQMGVGLAAAILIDATIVRAVLLPSIMVLLGERNWWLPKPLKRLPALDH